MTLRTRVALAAGFAVLLAVVAVSVAVYLVERGNLRDQIDQSLNHDGPVSGPGQHSLQRDASTVPDLPLMQDVFKQVVDRDGHVVMIFDDRPLPVTADVLAVARGEREESYFDADIDGTSVRVYVTSAGQGAALEVGRSLTEVEQALRQLVLTLIVISVGTVGLAVVIGRLVAAVAVAPVRRVAEAADTVAQTGELSHHLAVPAGDDLGRLADSFNTMLDALSESLAQQRQLVADASHELRTPLATVRTNVEVLTRADELAPDERAMLIRDTVAQIGELTRLVGDLVELARGDGQEEPPTVIDLDELTRRAVEVVGRNHPAILFRVDGVPSLIRGAPGRVSRAVSNLIDNAAKWSPPGAAVEIAVRDGTVTVRDHGLGVDPADLPHVFDRFYRSPQARTMPGSGLDLAIVKQVADSHGGTVTAATAPGCSGGPSPPPTAGTARSTMGSRSRSTAAPTAPSPGWSIKARRLSEVASSIG
jgi:two-component system, OmpR family, sensor histidine kinase MprB